MNKIGWLIRILATLAGAILTLIIAHAFNPFSAMTFIPQDKAYDVCITVYFSIMEIVLNWGIEKVNALIDSYFMTIEVFISHKDEAAEIYSKPKIRFNEFDLAEVALTVHMRGRKKYFTGLEIVLPQIAQADFQVGKRTIGAYINNQGDFCVKLSDICGSSDAIQLSQTFSVIIQRSPVDESALVQLSPELHPVKRHRRIKYSSNMAILQLEAK